MQWLAKGSLSPPYLHNLIWLNRKHSNQVEQLQSLGFVNAIAKTCTFLFSWLLRSLWNTNNIWTWKLRNTIKESASMQCIVRRIDSMHCIAMENRNNFLKSQNLCRKSKSCCPFIPHKIHASTKVEFQVMYITTIESFGITFILQMASLQMFARLHVT